jgi:hypothetical protein
MAQAVIRQPVTAEALVRAQVNPCEIYDGQSGTGTLFFWDRWFSSVNIILSWLSTLM